MWSASCLWHTASVQLECALKRSAFFFCNTAFGSLLINKLISRCILHTHHTHNCTHVNWSPNNTLSTATTMEMMMMEMTTHIKYLIAFNKCHKKVFRLIGMQRKDYIVRLKHTHTLSLCWLNEPHHQVCMLIFWFTMYHVNSVIYFGHNLLSEEKKKRQV